MSKKPLILTISALVLSLGLFAVNPPAAFADGNGSPVACNSNKNVNPDADNVLGSQAGSDDLVTVDVGAGNIATGVCIKSGEGTFGGVTHSEVLGNGIYEDGCYQVAGVGTQVVTVTRLLDSKSCKGISHIDVLFDVAPVDEPEEPVVPTTPGQTLGTSTQVDAPAAAVNAGGGIIAPALAFVGSSATLGYGLLRLRKAIR